MKKTSLIKIILFSVFTGLCFAQTADENTDESQPLISIDEIAQELESSETSEADLVNEEVVEEVVFDEESESDAEENPVIVKNENFWRGKTAVAAENEFPKGIFAMAKGYFPGDTLNVINSKTQKTTNVLVIGTIDQNDLVGIKFSQEAAAEIKITDKTDANVILDERINPPEIRENASAKLVIFGGDEGDYSSFEQPVSIIEDEEILTTTEPGIIDEIAVEFEQAEEDAAQEVPADDSYAAIVLDVPESVEEKAFEEESLLEEEEIAENPSEETVKEECLTEAASVEVEEKKEEKKIENKPVVTVKNPVPYKKLIANESMVRKGCYIQLAFLANEDNLQKFVDNYSDSLKLFLIAHKNGYKIFAGVFDEDDKGAALEYVKSLGFKDAFVRKLGK